MSDFKHHMKTGFVGCRHLANAYDPHRKRDVRLYHLPGDFTVVGVSDGTDSWIAPTACNPFSVDVVKLYKRIQAGAIIEPPGMHRVRVVVKTVMPPNPVQEQPTPRVLLRNTNVQRTPLIRR